MTSRTNSRQTPAPTHTKFMDAAMHELWEQFPPLPIDLRLYGGSAFALYLDHRRPKDFQLATPLDRVNTTLAPFIPWLQNTRVYGGVGYVEADIQIGRPVRVTISEIGGIIPYPLEEPMTAPNGVRVAHLTDLIGSKMEECRCHIARNLADSYLDLATCAREWPELTRKAIRRYARVGRHPLKTLSERLAHPPESGARGTR